MSMFIGYQPAATCTGGPTPGARALMSWYLGEYGMKGGINLGIYNCRDIRGSTTTSLHGEGRAADLGVNPHGAAYGDEVAELLHQNSGELGLQCIIWKRRIWSGSYPNAGFRPYGGTNPHLDHIHVELSWAAATDLTAQRIADVLAGRGNPAEPAAVRRTLREGATGDDVVELQQFFNRAFPAYEGTPIPTGPKRFGPQTAGVVKEFQRRAGLTADGVVGPKTYQALAGFGFR